MEGSSLFSSDIFLCVKRPIPEVLDDKYPGIPPGIKGNVCK